MPQMMPTARRSKGLAPVVSNERYVTLAIVIWTFARLEGCECSCDQTYGEIWNDLVGRHGRNVVDRAADSYDKTAYIRGGWQAAILSK